MIAKLKRFLYFPIASYFRFFATIRLNRWKPKIIVVTGSNGKTTLLHMLEAQIGEKARYSHHANSSFGIPFDILDLHRKSLLKSEWISLILKTPINAFKAPPKEKIYVVEADCDRPGEGKFLATLLKPEIVLWVSTAKTHSMYFEQLVKNEEFSTVEEAIAYEFGYFLEYCRDISVINGDSVLMRNQKHRTNAKIEEVKKDNSLKHYKVSTKGSWFEIDDKKYTFDALLPEEIFYSIIMCQKAVELLDLPLDISFSKFSLPPGRGSIFKGIKNITIIDSSYNANFSSMKAVVEMFEKVSDKDKWVVIGDMLEQGTGEREEHEKLADLLLQQSYQRIVLLGPRVKKYTLPKLQKVIGEKTQIDAFESPKEVLDFITANMRGGEVILFKGARFMEGIIEHLLIHKSDVSKLSRREKIWEIRRKQWGL
jgi:UDP-N-acetylmuramoyl-tripeptide--D-alanyl-D-alanine ligase